MRIKPILFTLLFVSGGLFAQLKSPDDFLGYQLGSHFTPHYKIVNYFHQTAVAMPQMMKLETYGETNEGRELLLAFVSSTENIAKLDEIRKNNLRLTGLLKDKPADVNAPVIVWLSYNVHGNEASSSEVSMKTLYELLKLGGFQLRPGYAHRAHRRRRADRRTRCCLPKMADGWRAASSRQRAAA